MSRIVPTVGRSILVRRGQEETAGIITFVSGDRPSGSDLPYRIGVAIQPNTNVGGWGGWYRVEFEEMLLLEDNDELPPSPLTVYAAWMPYQVQKAAAETAEVQA